MNDDHYFEHPLVKRVFHNNERFFRDVRKNKYSILDFECNLKAQLRDTEIAKVLALGVLAHREERHNIFRVLTGKEKRWRERFEKFSDVFS